MMTGAGDRLELDFGLRSTERALIDGRGIVAVVVGTGSCDVLVASALLSA